MEQQLPPVLEDPPDLVVVAVGANDVLHATPAPVPTRASWTRSWFDRLRGVAPVVALGIGDLSVIPRLPLNFQPVVARRSAIIDRAHKLVVADQDAVARVPVGRLSDPQFRGDEAATCSLTTCST